MSIEEQQALLVKMIPIQRQIVTLTERKLELLDVEDSLTEFKKVDVELKELSKQLKKLEEQI